MSRPGSAHRLFMSSVGSNGRQSTPRQHSHTLSVGSLNPTHRVTRRKSMSSTAVNNAAAMAMAVKEASGGSFEPGSYSSKRSSTSRAAAGVTNGNIGSYPAYPSSLPSHAAVFRASPAGANNGNTAIAEDPSVNPVDKGSNSKARMRRASEGSRLSKSEAKRSATSELKCETCGKGYKHSSCLTKHMLVSLRPHCTTILPPRGSRVLSSACHRISAVTLS